MLKPAVEACLKYNETPLESIPKSHHISYGREVSLGYLIVPNQFSSPLLSVLVTQKNCWTDDEDDDDDMLGVHRKNPMKDHGAFKYTHNTFIKQVSLIFINNNPPFYLHETGSEFTELTRTKTAIRVCVVRKSVVSIDDARRIRKEMGML